MVPGQHDVWDHSYGQGIYQHVGLVILVVNMVVKGHTLMVYWSSCDTQLIMRSKWDQVVKRHILMLGAGSHEWSLKWQRAILMVEIVIIMSGHSSGLGSCSHGGRVDRFTVSDWFWLTDSLTNCLTIKLFARLTSKLIARLRISFPWQQLSDLARFDVWGFGSTLPRVCKLPGPAFPAASNAPGSWTAKNKVQAHPLWQYLRQLRSLTYDSLRDPGSTKWLRQQCHFPIKALRQRAAP